MGKKINAYFFFKTISIFLLIVIISLFVGVVRTDALSFNVFSVDDFEPGRYAVYSGLPVNSNNNVRSKEFVSVKEVSYIEFNIPSQFSITVHEYMNNSFDSFIISTSGLSGNKTLTLDSSTEYVHFSIKRINNEKISNKDVNCITYSMISDDSDSYVFEYGRYAVFTGEPVSSENNIRSRDFIKIQGKTLLLLFPSEYNVTIHQYKDSNYNSFIVSNSNLTEKSSIDLNNETKYITVSIKHRNNSSIGLAEGNCFSLFWSKESDGFENGRYAVYTGEPIDSTNNIRTNGFIKKENDFLSLEIPKEYTITVHQYENPDYKSFIISNSGIVGNTRIKLEEETQYITLSIKHRNNSSISISESDLLVIRWECEDKPMAMLTIIDDDGFVEYYYQIYPMAKEKGVSIATAVPASYPGKSSIYMSWDMIKECQDNGMEILCHTYSHPLSSSINSMTQQDFYTDYSKAIEIFNSHGIKADLLVFSGSTGLYNKAQVPAQQLFNGAFLAGDNRTNYSGFDPYRIYRYRIGSDYPWNKDILKQLIDDLYETGGWMVWMMHTSDRERYTSEVPAILAELIDYCNSLDIPIVTAEEGFNYFSV